MYLRNIEGVARTADSIRTNDKPRAANVSARNVTSTGDTVAAAAVPRSRGAFFEMMLTAQSTAPAPSLPQRSTTSAARPLSSDENSTSVRSSSRTTAPQVAAVRNSPVVTSSLGLNTVSPVETPPPSENPVDVINALLTKLGYDASAFQTRVTSAHIAVPGLAYDYPLLEVTVNGERVGFHLPSAMKDPRITAANISTMLGHPVMNFAAFA